MAGTKIGVVRFLFERTCFEVQTSPNFALYQVSGRDARTLFSHRMISGPTLQAFWTNHTPKSSKQHRPSHAQQQLETECRVVSGDFERSECTAERGLVQDRHSLDGARTRDESSQWRLTKGARPWQTSSLTTIKGPRLIRRPSCLSHNRHGWGSTAGIHVHSDPKARLIARTCSNFR